MPQQIRLSNGVHIPFMGLGTGGKRSTEEETEKMLRWALDIGYRHIDTAQMYGTEKVIGRVLKEYFDSGKLKREDVCIVTKLPHTAMRPEFVRKCLKLQLDDLQLEYVDLYLVHTPCATKAPDGGFLTEMYSDKKYEYDLDVNINETWKAMEEIYNDGLAKAIGLSNFSVEQIQRIYSSAEIKPMNLQIELHLHFQQKELVTLCQSLNITVTAYAPLGCPGKKGINGWPEEGPLDEPLVKQLAEKYNRTPSQILLRHLTQKNIIIVPKSTNEQRLKENFESSQFFITDEDMQALNEVPPRKRLYTWGAETKTHFHPEFPFTEFIK